MLTDVARAAEHILDALHINDLKDLQLLELIALERRAIVVEKPLRGAEASVVVIGNEAVITVSSNIENPQRRRFSIAHELGHFELHRELGLYKLCESADINDWKIQRQQQNRESEANDFAAALLLPDRFFGALCTDEDPSLTYISDLASRFDVSLTATAIRYSQLCAEPIAVVYSERGYIKWFRSSSDFEDLNFFVTVNSQVHSSTMAARLFEGRAFASPTQKTVHASAWLQPGKYHRETTIQEQSFAMPKYGAVLTLLWVDEEVDDSSEW